MFQFTVKVNGFAFGQCKGKKRAIDRIRHHVATYSPRSSKQWKLINGETACVVKTGTYEEIYTVERTN